MPQIIGQWQYHLDRVVEEILLEHREPQRERPAFATVGWLAFVDSTHLSQVYDR